MVMGFLAQENQIVRSLVNSILWIVFSTCPALYLKFVLPFDHVFGFI